MPSLLLHSAALEHLAARPEGLPEPVRRALADDLEYARFGALLPDLPWCEGFRGTLVSMMREGPVPHFAHVLHDRAPVECGLKMAELVADGALVGRDAGMAFVSGYFVHLVLDRLLHPTVDALVEQYRRRDETPSEARRRIEWLQGVLYTRDLSGADEFGTPAIRRHFQLAKSAVPVRGVGRGLFEVIRLSTEAVLQDAPRKEDVDRWMRGAFFHGLYLSSPLGRWQGAAQYPPLAERELYKGDDVDVPKEVEGALTRAREVLGALHTYLDRGTFTPRGRARFLAQFPEGSVAAAA